VENERKVRRMSSDRQRRFSETIATHHRRIGQPYVLGRSTVAQMRKALTFRSDAPDAKPHQVQAQANTSWWVSSLSVPELKGWLEIDDDWRPIACGVVDDLRWVAPPGAGNGWTMTYDKEFAAGDSYKVRAQRDRCPPGSKKGVVKLDGDAVIAEFVFYRLAPPVQFIIVPGSVPSRLDWERDIYADQITPEIDAVLSALEQRENQVRYSGRRTGALIWWIDGARPAPELWKARDDPTAMALVALNAVGHGVETGEFHVAPDGTPFFVDNQYLFDSLSTPFASTHDYSDSITYWSEFTSDLPKVSRQAMRSVWERLASLDGNACATVVLGSSGVTVTALTSRRICDAWEPIRRFAQGLSDAI
jgi:hypothetical protein